MSVFDVDFNTLVKQLLPVRLRQAITIAWLKCLAAPVKYVYDLFQVNRNSNLYLLAHNGQICYLEAVLNDTFDNVLRRIFISDGGYYDPVYLYLDAEERPVFIDLDSEAGASVIPTPDPVRLYLAIEVAEGVGGFSFIVNVPTILPFDMARLKALVDLYRLPGRTYNVVTF